MNLSTFLTIYTPEVNILWYHFETIYKRNHVKVLLYTSLFTFTKKEITFSIFNSILFSKNTFQKFLILFNSYINKYTKNWFQ